MKVKKMPIIQFDHFMLRPIKTSDYKDMFEYGHDYDVTKYLTWGPMVLPREAKKSIKEIFLVRPKKGIPVGYAIVDITKKKMIGTIDFHTKVNFENAVEIGYALNKKYWGHGIMTKALKMIIEVGFEYYQYDKLIIKHLENNPASGKVITNNGFDFIKSYPYQYEKLHSKLSSNMMVYEMTKEKYDEIKSSQGNI